VLNSCVLSCSLPFFFFMEQCSTYVHTVRYPGNDNQKYVFEQLYKNVTASFSICSWMRIPNVLIFLTGKKFASAWKFNVETYIQLNTINNIYIYWFLYAPVFCTNVMGKNVTSQQVHISMQKAHNLYLLQSSSRNVLYHDPPPPSPK
jgi:hypothetical protein